MSLRNNAPPDSSQCSRNFLWTLGYDEGPRSISYDCESQGQVCSKAQPWLVLDEHAEMALVQPQTSLPHNTANKTGLCYEFHESSTDSETNSNLLTTSHYCDTPESYEVPTTVDKEIGSVLPYTKMLEVTKLCKEALDSRDFTQFRVLLHDHLNIDIPLEEPNDLEVPEQLFEVLADQKIERYIRRLKNESTRQQDAREREELSWLYANDRFYFGDFISQEDQLERFCEENPPSSEELAQWEELDRDKRTEAEQALERLAIKLSFEALIRNRDTEGLAASLRMFFIFVDRCDHSQEMDTPCP